MVGDDFKLEVARRIDGERIARDQAYFGAIRTCGDGFQNVEQHGLREFRPRGGVEQWSKTLLGVGEIFDRD
jgi:hypothetical protein